MCIGGIQKNCCSFTITFRHSRKANGSEQVHWGHSEKLLLFQHYIEAQQENKRERASALGAFKKTVAVSALH
jgi:hypothetical protein